MIFANAYKHTLTFRVITTISVTSFLPRFRGSLIVIVIFILIFILLRVRLRVSLIVITNY